MKENILPDNSTKLFIKIEYDEQIEAEYLSNYINALNKELKYFLKSKNLHEKYSEKLYIKKIKEGSIEIFPNLELLYGATIPLLQQMTALPVLFDFMSGIVKNLLSFAEANNWQMNNNRLNFYLNINSMVNNTKSITYNYHSDAGQKVIEQPKGKQAELIESNLKEKLKEKEKLTIGEIYRSVPLYWDVAKFTKNIPYNFKGQVDSIVKKPLNIIWDSDEDKKFMTEESHFGQAWQHLNYVVDIEIQQIKDNYCYKILKVHKEQTFYDED